MLPHELIVSVNDRSNLHQLCPFCTGDQIKAILQQQYGTLYYTLSAVFCRLRDTPNDATNHHSSMLACLAVCLNCTLIYAVQKRTFNKHCMQKGIRNAHTDVPQYCTLLKTMPGSLSPIFHMQFCWQTNKNHCTSGNFVKTPEPRTCNRYASNDRLFQSTYLLNFFYVKIEQHKHLERF